MSSIFVSYRRNDAPAHAGRIYDRLAERVGKDNVYMDLDSTVPGADFGDVIEQTIAQCDALIAVIGRDWVSALRPSRRVRRADGSEDWVRREIAAAIARNIRVIPVLVQGARMPLSAELPDDIKGLARRHAMELSETAWSAQLGLLMDALPVATATSLSAGGLQPSEPSASGRGRPLAHHPDPGVPARDLAAAAVERADVVAEPPTGTVTLLFTDIEASTRLLQRQRDRYANLLADPDRLLRDAFAANDGREIGTRGDGFFVAFRRAWTIQGWDSTSSRLTASSRSCCRLTSASGCPSGTSRGSSSTPLRTWTWPCSTRLTALTGTAARRLSRR
jgi:hypothetical protein